MKMILPNKLKRFITVKVVCLLILTTTISASLTSITAFARSTSSSPPPGNSAINSKNPPPLIKISTILLTPENKKVPALTNAKGFVLYYYNLDTDPKNPNCSKVTKPICAQEWPPLLLPKGGSLKVPG